MRTIAALLLLALVSPAARAQTQPSIAGYDVVLVPVFFFGAGARGSQWETSVRVASSASQDAPMPVPLFESVSIGCSDVDGNIEPDETRSVCREFASPSGLLLYVPKTLDPHDVHVAARIRDLSRQAASAGTEIPIVRESDFRTGDLLLLDIPSDANFRANLRVYGGLETFTPELRFIHPGGHVGVTIYDARDLRTPIASTTLDLSAPSAIAGSPYLTHPAYASIGDLTAAFPELTKVPRYSIRVRAYQTLADPPRELSAWAFVALTNNDTQQVTTVSP